MLTNLEMTFFSEVGSNNRVSLISGSDGRWSRVELEAKRSIHHIFSSAGIKYAASLCQNNSDLDYRHVVTVGVSSLNALIYHNIICKQCNPQCANTRFYIQYVSLL